MKIKLNRVLKILLIIVLLSFLFMTFCGTVDAWNANFGQFDDKVAEKSGETVTNIVGAVINLVSIVAAGIAIIMFIIIGLNYIQSGPEGKADAKKELPSYITGAIILFAASGILKLLQMFIDGNINNIGTSSGNGG